MRDRRSTKHNKQTGARAIEREREQTQTNANKQARARSYFLDGSIAAEAKSRNRSGDPSSGGSSNSSITAEAKPRDRSDDPSNGDEQVQAKDTQEMEKEARRWAKDEDARLRQDKYCWRLHANIVVACEDPFKLWQSAVNLA